MIMRAVIWLAIGLLGMMLLGLTGCRLGEGVNTLIQGTIDFEHYDESERLSWSIPYDGQRLIITNLLGRIEVEGRAEPGYVAVRPTVELVAVKKVRGLELEAISVEVEVEPDEIRITTDFPPQMGRRLEGFPPRLKDEVGWVEFSVSVPANVELMLEQDVGDIAVRGLEGQNRLSASTGVGRIEVEGAKLIELMLKSDAGEVAVRDVQATELAVDTAVGELSLHGAQFERAKLTSDTGGIAIVEVGGKSLTVSTDLGGISLNDIRVSRLKAVTDMGGITFKLSRALAEPFTGELSADMGGLTVEIPAEISLRIEAQTEFGRVSLFGAAGTSVNRRGTWPGEVLTLLLGDGLSRLKLSTDMGGIEIIILRPSEVEL